MLDYSRAQEFLDGRFDDEIKSTIVNALILSTLLGFIPEIGWLLSEAYIIHMYVKLTRITTVPISWKQVFAYFAKYIALSLLAILALLCAMLSLLSLFTVGITSILCALIMFLIHYKLIYMFVDALREEAKHFLGVF